MPDKIVFTDSRTLNPGDLDFADLHTLGEVKVYDYTAPEDLIDRARTAEILITNKTKITRSVLTELNDLRCICVAATGFNNVDIDAARERNISVCNVGGYSTTAVAQHVFALMSAVENRVAAHDRSVKNGDWTDCRDFSYTLSPIREFADKTMGIYGFGRIGQQVAKIANAYGMRVVSVHTHPKRDKGKGAEFVNWKVLLQESDYLTLHAPLKAENEGIINAEALKEMKKTAVLLNTGRGGLINEDDLAAALESGEIRCAALDVLSQEPPPADNPLLNAKNCLITPHIAWASIKARKKLLAETIENIKAFQAGEVRNVVNG